MNRRADFPLLAANPDLHYLDSAATSQKPRVVLDAIREFLRDELCKSASRSLCALGCSD
jgi:selenocysteine lyase/cysteine desulfurase